MVKSLKHFRTYIGYSKVIGYVPHGAVKDILSQQDCLGIRGTWVSKIQEDDLEIKPTKLIKGQGLAKMLTQTNEKAIDMICENTRANPTMIPTLQDLYNHWYSDIIYFLLHPTCSDHLK